MFNEILYIDSIADFLDCSETEALSINKRLTHFIKTYSTVYKWSNINYINDVLLGLFSLSSDLKGDKKPIFYSLVFRYLGTKDLFVEDLINMFFNTDSNIEGLTSLQKAQFNFYLENIDFIPNDLNVYESDLDLTQDLLLCHIPITLESGATARMESDTIMFFRPKGSNIALSIEEALHLLIERYSAITTHKVKQYFLSLLLPLILKQKRLSV